MPNFGERVLFLAMIFIPGAGLTHIHAFPKIQRTHTGKDEVEEAPVIPSSVPENRRRLLRRERT